MLGVAALVAGCSPGDDATTADTGGTGGGDSLLEVGIGEAIEAWERELGDGIEAVDVTVYPDYAILEARQPDALHHVDRWHFQRDGELLDPDPVALTDEDEGALDLEAYPLDSVSWDRLPALVDEALVAADVEEPESVYVVVARDRPTTEAVRMRVYVSGPRSSGYLLADARGNVLEVYDD